MDTGDKWPGVLVQMTSRGSFQPQPFCHSVIALTFMVIGSWEKWIFEMKFCLGFFLVFLKIHVLELYQHEFKKKIYFYYISLTSIF